MNLTKWLDDTSKDLRIDWYIAPEFEWEERASQSNGSSSWTRRKISAPRQQQLQIALRDLFAEKTFSHLLLVDDAGSGKSVASLRIELLLNDSSIRTEIFGDSLPRLVIYWSGRLPAGKISNLESALIETLTSQPSWLKDSSTMSSRDLRNRAHMLVDYALRNRRLIVIVDAFDELTESQRDKVADWFEETSEFVRWIITSRDDAVKDFVASSRLFDQNQFKRLRLESFDSNLQDQYIARAIGKTPSEWRSWLKGSSKDWDDLLGLPNTLREIVRFVNCLGQQHPAWSSPSDLFCQFSVEMIFRELKKRKHDRAWKKLKEDVQDSNLSPQEGVEFIEMVLGAVALEMATREKWTVVTSNHLTQEIKSIIDRVEERFARACKERGIPKRQIVKYWSWAYNFASKFQLHKDSTQGILNARWISFRSKRIQEMWAARYITKYASELDARDSAKPDECLLGHNGNFAWENLWECAIRMPVWSEIKEHGVEEKSYQRALEVLFERPINSSHRRPTELMWAAEQWLLSKPSLRHIVDDLHEYLAAQFKVIKQKPEYQPAIEELLDPTRYVLLQCGDNAELDNDTGVFVMGPDRWGYCRSVLLTQRFGISRYQLTLEQYSVWDNLESASEKSLPVRELSWLDCYFFLVGLSGERVKLSDGLEYRFTFPTEACWEYACRAGNTTDYCYGEEQKELAHYAWYRGNSDRRVHPVGEKLSNAWGLHDMLGNVQEWCWDWLATYPTKPVTDPVGPKDGSLRVFRGGCWCLDPAYCGSANRYGGTPEDRISYLGFRLALSSTGIPQSPEADKSSGVGGGS